MNKVSYQVFNNTSTDEVHTILQSHTEGSSLRGITRISNGAYGTVVSLVNAASQKAQLVHNRALQAVETEAIVGDELWSFVKKTKAMPPEELEVGD